MAGFDATGIPAAWYSDPWGRAVQRYHNGQAWTAYVIDANGAQRIDEGGEKPAGQESMSGSAASGGIVIQNVIQAPQPYPAGGGYLPVATKNMGTAVALAFLFGPLGLLYATVTGGLVMLGISILFVPLTLGAAVLLIWPGCIIWAVIATNNANAGAMAAMRQPQPIYRSAPMTNYAPPVPPPQGTIAPDRQQHPPPPLPPQ